MSTRSNIQRKRRARKRMTTWKFARPMKQNSLVDLRTHFKKKIRRVERKSQRIYDAVVRFHEGISVSSSTNPT